MISCSLFCGWKVDDEDDMEDEEVDDSGEDWVESSPLDLKQTRVSDLTNQTVRGHPFITFAKFSGFWTPSPLVRNLG